ncbi:MAG: flagellar hook-associated protein FlgK [Holophaga sp.]|jgi:flagellar hook-associated protein 1 FlgK
MANLTASLGIGLTGLQVAQEAMSVIGHNIANVNTPDFSQQAAVISTNPAQNFGGVMYGTGATVTQVQALRNQFLNLQVTQSLCSQNGAQTRYSGVQAVSSAFTDDGTTGLNTQIQQFFTSIQTLAANPEDDSLRENVVGMAQSMLQEFQSAYQTVSAQISSANQQVGSLVPEINSLTSQIATLNQQISQATNPSDDNDAIDQRQELTDQLAALVGIQVSTSSDNQYQITLDTGAATLVSGNSAYQMSTAPTPGNGNNLSVYVQAGATSINVTDNINGGQLGAQMDLRDTILPAYQSQLDNIAGSLAGDFNQIHMAGFSLPDATTGQSTTGTLFFTGAGINPATGLVNTDPVTGKPIYSGIINSLQVNPAVAADPSLIAASATNGNAGDNTNALSLAGLQTALNTVDTNDDGVGDSGPFSTVVSSLINQVGTQSQQYNTTATNQQNLTTALQTQQSSVSGVDLDQQAAQLLAFQQAYQASAQFISTISQLTNTLMTTVSAATTA